MAFVNEYVSDEDVKQYDLLGLEQLFYPARKKPLDRYTWTRDKERDIFLTKGQGAGKENDIPVWVLYRQGKLSAFQIYRGEGSSRKVYERPFRIVWHFEGFYQNSSKSFFVPPKEELPGFFQDLKEALTTRGVLGVVEQIPETIVSFDESFNVA